MAILLVESDLAWAAVQDLVRAQQSMQVHYDSAAKNHSLKQSPVSASTLNEWMTAVAAAIEALGAK